MRDRALGLIRLSRRAALAHAASVVAPDPPASADLMDIAARPLAVVRADRRNVALDRLREARIALRNVERVLAR